jgi:ferredoxin-NADP reductase
MSNPTVRLERREQVAHGTTAFHFSKPAGFTFKPGQAVDVILAGPLAAEGANGRHAFSIVSAPFEPELVVATRMRDSAFKNALKDLPIGSPVELDGPFGTLTLHKDRTRPAVFIAGGIGVTPFMSILRQAAHDRSPQRLALLYSNRRPQDSAFFAELQRLEQQHQAFRLLATMTQMSESKVSWQGETGAIDETMVREIAKDLARPIYYLAGPPAMVTAIQSTLTEAGVDEDDIRVEEFYGY